MEVRLKIEKESEKAVFVTVMTEKYFGCGDCEKGIWLPKSQITIGNSGEYVVDIPDWLVKKNDISRRFNEFKVSSDSDEKLNQYFEKVEAAKAAGVKGIRKGMRWVTIVAKAQEQGVALAI